MSREIRPVALDWEHPIDPGPPYGDGSPRYRPLYSREYLRFHLRDESEHPEDWPGGIDRAEYMPEMREGTPYGWQMYQTVSEGSPVSPVFGTKEELAAWLSSPAAGDERVSPAAAAAFVADGWAPSFQFTPETGLVSGVEFGGLRQKSGDGQ